MLQTSCSRSDWRHSAALRSLLYHDHHRSVEYHVFFRGTGVVMGGLQIDSNIICEEITNVRNVSTQDKGYQWGKHYYYLCSCRHFLLLFSVFYLSKSNHYPSQRELDSIKIIIICCITTVFVLFISLYPFSYCVSTFTRLRQIRVSLYNDNGHEILSFVEKMTSFRRCT